jgi:hypothetical protein
MSTRRTFLGTFDDANLCLDLEAGHGSIGAVLRGWKNPIQDHDASALQVEEAMVTEKAALQVFRSKDRHLANWEVAFELINSDPSLLAEYHALKAELVTYNAQWRLAQTPAAKITLEAKKARYTDIRASMERVLQAEEQMKLAKEDRDRAQQDLLAASKELVALKKRERLLADLISDDHVLAVDRGQKVGDLFPAIQSGFIITRLFGVEELDLECLDFADICALLAEAERPHTLEFAPYPWRKDYSASGCWVPLREWAVGRYIVDEDAAQEGVIEAASRGDLTELREKLMRGCDIAACDVAGCSALHAAAAEGHLHILSFLLEEGAAMEVRNKNMETPLLMAVMRGSLDAVSWLADHGACLDVLDRARCNALCHAAAGGYLSIVRFLLDSKKTAQILLMSAESRWGWTPLHFAAHGGFCDVVDVLLERGASPYAKTNSGLTPLEVAREVKQLDVVHLLEAHIRSEPAHIVWSGKRGGEVWLGGPGSIEPDWSSAQNFDAILLIGTATANKKSGQDGQFWIEKEAQRAGLSYMRVECQATDPSEDEWTTLVPHIRPTLSFIQDVLSTTPEQQLLICCDQNGSCAYCAALWTVFCLLNKKCRIQDTVQGLLAAQPDMFLLSPPLLLGLRTMQDDLDDKVAHQLSRRVHRSPLLSLGF